MPPGRKQKKPTARKGGKKNNTQRRPPQPQGGLIQRKNAPVQQNQNMRGRQPRTQGQIGNAIRVRLPTIGMSDLMTHRITWVMGTVYVGNGTLGATNSVYAANQGKSATYTAGAGGGFWLPFAPADPDVGATYAASILKLYRRLRMRKAKVHFLTVQSSTTNNMVLAAAPCRGPPGSAELPVATTDTSAAQTLQNLMSVAGMESCDSFENMSLDLTPYIAGGAGALQNEFAIANPYDATEVVGSIPNLLQAVPTAFQVAGNSTVTALQGTVTHNIVCEMIVDLLDFVGAVPVDAPIGFSLVRKGAATKPSYEEERAHLMGKLAALVRNDNNKREPSPARPQ